MQASDAPLSANTTSSSPHQEANHSPSSPTLPMQWPHWEDGDIPSIDQQPLTIDPWIQSRLQSFIENRGNPITALMLVSVRTGKVLAMVQGQSPQQWDGKTHTALHTGFPAASLFKTVVTSSVLEISDLDPNRPIGLYGGCGKVNARGAWMRTDISSRRNKLTLRRAYGNSCNGFFAKLAINEIGLGPILRATRLFGWNDQPIPADFYIPASPMRRPNPITSSVHTVGRFAAGFGSVGLSVAHASWQMLAIANLGIPKPLQIFSGTHPSGQAATSEAIMSEATAQQLLDIMDATVLGGTATSAFRRGKYRSLRGDVGGKTGTLTGSTPFGLTTWFAGVYPLENPEVVVAAVTVLEDLWHFKAANLAAESFYLYRQRQQQQTTLVNTENHSLQKN